VIKIMNDALLAADQGMVTLVVLLDYSAAFDTVDHSIALSILEHNFGVTSSSLSWFHSYLSNRTFRVLSNSQESAPIDLDCSLPQGSTLGPLLFITYASQLQKLLINTVLHSTDLLTTPSSANQRMFKMSSRLN